MVTQRKQQTEQASEQEDDAAILREIADLDAAEGDGNSIAREARDDPFGTGSATVERGETEGEGAASPEVPPETEPEAAQPSPAPAPAETPAEAPTETPPAQPPVDQDWLRQRNQQLEQQAHELAAQQQAAQLAEQERLYNQQLQAQGLAPEVSAQLASERRHEQQRMHQMQQRASGLVAEQQAKMDTAMLFAERHGVPPRDLMAYDTPHAMEAAARSRAENQQLRNRIAALEKGRVTPQQTNFDSSRAAPSAGASDEALVDSANLKPSSEWTDTERAAVERLLGQR